jgi:hypothetical protein
MLCPLSVGFHGQKPDASHPAASATMNAPMHPGLFDFWAERQTTRFALGVGDNFFIELYRNIFSKTITKRSASISLELRSTVCYLYTFREKLHRMT